MPAKAINQSKTPRRERPLGTEADDGLRKFVESDDDNICRISADNAKETPFIVVGRMLKTYLTWRLISTTLLLALCPQILWSIAPAASEDREQRLREIIKEQRLISQAFDQQWRRSPKLDSDHGVVGTALATIGWPQAFCASIAFLLGKDRVYRRLGEFAHPRLKGGMSSSERASQEAVALMLNNQIDATEQALALSSRDRIERWNLSCVGRHNIGREHYQTSNSPDAQFAVVGDQLQILGEIDTGFFRRFSAALKRNSHVKTIALGSGGGSVRDALQAGLLIRASRLDTTLFSDCTSACPLIFLGGVQRTIYAPYPRLGFHQASRNGRAISLKHPLYDDLKEYARLMGVDATYLVRSMHLARPAEMNYPDVHTLCEPKFATWIQRSC